MPFLAINGVTFPTGIQGASEPIRELGFVGASYGGQALSSIRATKKDLLLNSVPLPESDAQAWDQFLRGLGEYWSFDSGLYGSKGTGPAVTTGLSITSGSPSYLSTPRLQIEGNATPRFFEVTLGWLATKWTVAHWEKNDNIPGGTLNSWVSTSDGRHWANGVVNGSGASSLSVAGQAVRITGPGAGINKLVDELVILPFEIPTSWGPSFHSHAALGRAYAPLPRLHLHGDAITEATYRVCSLEVMSSKIIRSTAGDRRLLTATLMEN